MVPRIECVKSKLASIFIIASYVEALSRYYFFRSMTYTSSRPASLHNFNGCHLHLKRILRNHRFSITFTLLVWHIVSEIILNESGWTDYVAKILSFYKLCVQIFHTICMNKKSTCVFLVFCSYTIPFYQFLLFVNVMVYTVFK